MEFRIRDPENFPELFECDPVRLLAYCRQTTGHVLQQGDEAEASPTITLCNDTSYPNYNQGY